MMQKLLNINEINISTEGSQKRSSKFRLYIQKTLYICFYLKKYPKILIKNLFSFSYIRRAPISAPRPTITHLCRPVRSTFAVRDTASLGIRGAPEVSPLCRETQSLGQQMLNARVGINGICIHEWGCVCEG